MRINDGLTLVYLNFSNFHYSQVSVGLASIYTFLTMNNVMVDVVEASSFKNIDYLIEKIKSLNNYYIGISTTELHFGHAVEIAEEIKKKEDVKIILGGAYPTLFPLECLSYPFIDFVCVGDGEHTLLNLIKEGNPSNIQGLWYKVENNIINNGVSKIFDLDEYKITDYSCFSEESVCSKRDFLGETSPLIFTWTSRGCPFNCSYCCNNELIKKTGGKIRFRSADNFYDELIHLKNKYNENNFFLCDENFLACKTHVELISEKLLKNNILDINFGFLSRPEHINYENIGQLEKLKQIGWKWVSIGIEIGNEKKRKKYLNRNHSNEQIVTAFKICRELNIKTNAFIISGFYFETIHDILVTNSLLMKCIPDNIECSYFYPLKSTILYDYYINKELILNNTELVSYFDSLSIVHPKFSNEKLQLIKEYWSKWTPKSDILVLINKLRS